MLLLVHVLMLVVVGEERYISTCQLFVLFFIKPQIFEVSLKYTDFCYYLAYSHYLTSHDTKAGIKVKRSH